MTNKVQNAVTFQALKHTYIVPTNFVNKSSFKNSGVHQPVAGMHLISSVYTWNSNLYKDCVLPPYLKNTPHNLQQKHFFISPLAHPDLIVFNSDTLSQFGNSSSSEEFINSNIT